MSLWNTQNNKDHMATSKPEHIFTYEDGEARVVTNLETFTMEVKSKRMVHDPPVSTYNIIKILIKPDNAIVVEIMWNGNPSTDTFWYSKDDRERMLHYLLKQTNVKHEILADKSIVVFVSNNLL